jgi:hypothetical protein
MHSGRRSPNRRGPWRLTAGLAAMYGGIVLVLACSDSTTPPFSTSRATVAGRISAGGTGLARVSISPVLYYELACTGPALPVTLQPATVTSAADGRFRVEIEAFGFSSFDGCVGLTVRRPEDGATMSVTKAPVTFVDVAKGPPVATQFDVVWP